MMRSKFTFELSGTNLGYEVKCTWPPVVGRGSGGRLETRMGPGHSRGGGSGGKSLGF